MDDFRQIETMAESSTTVDSDPSVKPAGIDPVSYVAGQGNFGRTNPPPITLDPLVVWRNVRILFANRTLARITIVMWITYIFDCATRPPPGARSDRADFAFNIGGSYLPLILVKRAGAQNHTIRETYASYIAIYAPGIVAVLLAGALIQIPYLGRKWSMALTAALMGMSFFLYAVVSTWGGSIGFNMCVGSAPHGADTAQARIFSVSPRFDGTDDRAVMQSMFNAVRLRESRSKLTRYRSSTERFQSCTRPNAAPRRPASRRRWAG